MPSNDDMKQQNEEGTKGRTSGDAPIASVLLDDHAVSGDETSNVNSSANEASFTPLYSDHSMPQEFTFFQKKKRADQAVLVPSVAYASTQQVTTYAARLNSAVAVNARTQRHIAELMTLMSDVARTMTADAAKPTCKRFRRSKWLFYACLVSFGVGWFLLFPYGHNFITQLVLFWVR